MPKKQKPAKKKNKKLPKPKAPAKSTKSKITSLKKIKPKKSVAGKSKVKSKVKSKAKPKSKPKSKPKIRTATSKSARPAPVKVPSKQFAGAVNALESGIKLMYAEDFARAIKTFHKVIAEYPDEPEVQASAKARIQACEKKMQERSRTVFRTADDHYNVAVALMNGGDLESALTHLQSALKLAPKADHVLYAMAAAHALQGNMDQALSYLKQSIQYRPENRFQAAQDNDFAVLAEEQAFKDLVTPPDA